MIPKIAHFYWSGPPMSWLREQSLESFRHFNPEWRVVMHGNPAIESPLDIGHDSDRSRYAALFQEGGFYFDTDIIFTAPIPEAWLLKDNAMVSRNGECLGVACLGAKQGSRFFEAILDLCSARASSLVKLDYQAFGIKIFSRPKRVDVRERAYILGETILEIDPKELFPYGWADVELLWSPVERKPSDLAVGVHWFGGDMLSREMEPLFSAENQPPCLVSDALQAVLVAK